MWEMVRGGGGGGSRFSGFTLWRGATPLPIVDKSPLARHASALLTNRAWRYSGEADPLGALLGAAGAIFPVEPGNWSGAVEGECAAIWGECTGRARLAAPSRLAGGSPAAAQGKADLQQNLVFQV